jgi:hypothetical protein
MKWQEALVAWNPGTDQIRVGPLIGENDADWTDHPIRYRMTGGAAYRALRDCKDKAKRDMMLFITFHEIVVRDRIPIAAVHEAFLAIDEYRQRIAPDIKGAEAEYGELGGW